MANVMDIVRDCSEMLQNAESDVEKISALLFAAQHIRSEECDSRSKAILFKAVGTDFLSRMLLGRLSVPESEDCPKETYVSTALAIITGFCVEPDLARNKEMLRLVPHILKILEDCDEPLLEELLQYLRCIIQHPEGRRSLLSHGAMKRFVDLYSRLKSDEIVDMTLILTQTPGVDDVWDGNSESFNSLIFQVAIEFENTHSKRKFKLCTTLRWLLYSYNKERAQSEVLNVYAWHRKVFSGLRDILTSRINDEQRDPALKLAAMMLDHFGLVWADETTEEHRKFELLLVRLSSIEVRMQLEDQPLEKILKNADLVTSCFTILEVGITQFLKYKMESWAKNQIVESFAVAGNAVLTTVKSLVDRSSTTRRTSEEKFFIYAMIRFLSLGFAHEVLILNSTVYEVMPFVMEMATDSFYSYKNWYEENAKVEANALLPVGSVQPTDFLPIVFPALKQFVTEDAGVQIILGSMDVFLESLKFYWGIIQPQLTLMRESGNGVNSEGEASIHRAKHDIWQVSKGTIVCLFELLTETVIIQPKVAENPSFSTVFAFISSMLPDFDPNISGFRPMHATASILGLLLVKHRKETPSENDPNVLLVVKSSLCFLRAYCNKVQRTDDSVFATESNPRFWVSIKELWFLGMYTLRKLMELLPWIKPGIENEAGSAFMEYLTSDDDFNTTYSGPP